MNQPPYMNQPPPMGFQMGPGAPYPPPGSSYPPPMHGGYGPPQPHGYAPQEYAPAADAMMPMPTSYPSCPPGLEYLTQINQLLVKQKVELFEAFAGFETANKYTIKNSMGQKVYFAKEDTDCCTRNCLGAPRPFTMEIFDNTSRKVLTLERPFRCRPPCCIPCCLQVLKVYDANGSLLGSIDQNWTLLIPVFSIKNASGDTVLKLRGPMCTFSLCGDVEFSVMSRDSSVEVGKIVKQWSGLAREAFTDADHFGISFPGDLDVTVKAVLLGAVFLIDFMYFEKSGNNN